MFRIFEFILSAPATDPLVQQIATKLREGEALMTANGFEKMVVEDFCEVVINTLKRCLDRSYDRDNL